MSESEALSGVQEPLQVEVSSIGGSIVCRLRGSASMEACELLNERLLEAAAEATKLLVVDLADLKFICSLGLGSIVAAHLRMARNQGDVRLVAPQPQVREVLELTKLDTLLPIWATVKRPWRADSAALQEA